MDSTTDKRLYFIGLTTLFRLDIQFVPENLKLSSSAEFPEITIVGRNTPQYQHTGGREQLTLKLDFHAVESSKEDVLRKINWLKSLRYSNGFGSPPEKVKLVWGDMFQDEEWLVKQVDVEFSLFDKVAGFLPRQAYATVTLLYDPKVNIKWNNLRKRSI